MSRSTQISVKISATSRGRRGLAMWLLCGASLVIILDGTIVTVALPTIQRSLPVRGSYPAHLLGPLVLFGAGGGLTLPALASLAMSGATQSDAGLASGLFNTTQQIGAALGVAVLSTLSAARTASLEAAGQGSAAALTSGYRLAFATGAGLTVAAVITAAMLLRSGGAAPRPSKITELVTGNAES